MWGNIPNLCPYCLCYTAQNSTALLHTLVHIASELSVPPGLRLATSPPRPSKAKATANPLTKSKIAKEEDFYILKKGLQNLKTAIYKKTKKQAPDAGGCARTGDTAYTGSTGLGSKYQNKILQQLRAHL